MPPEKFHICTLPRIDLLFNEEYQLNIKNEIYKKYPLLKEKPCVVYAPTFRKDESDFEKYFNELINEFDFNKYNLVVKLHPLSRVTVSDERVVFDTSFSTFQMISVADKFISDYSCVVYEAGVKGIPLYFYNYDMAIYEDVRSLTINYEDLPGFKEQKAKDLVASLEKPYDYNYLKSYIDK